MEIISGGDEAETKSMMVLLCHCHCGLEAATACCEMETWTMIGRGAGGKRKQNTHGKSRNKEHLVWARLPWVKRVLGHATIGVAAKKSESQGVTVRSV
jgi:hypothetical protein